MERLRRSYPADLATETFRDHRDDSVQTGQARDRGNSGSRIGQAPEELDVELGKIPMLDRVIGLLEFQSA